MWCGRRKQGNPYAGHGTGADGNPQNILWERFGLEVEFDAGSIVYKETLAEPVEGIGHFEPLRHYAEVHLLLEPGERGSGLQFASLCSEDMLDRNWQRLILTHLEENVMWVC